MGGRASGLIAVVLAGVASTVVGVRGEEPPTSLGREPAVHAIVVDPAAPSTIYLGTDDGLAFSDDGGSTWTVRPLAAREHVNALALDPRDRSTLWAGTGHDLRRTRDRGVTWTTMTMPPHRVPLWLRIAARAIGFYPEALEEAAAAGAAGQYQFNSVVVVPGGEPPVVLAGAIGVLRSTDDGASWHRMPIVAREHRSSDSALGITQLVRDPHAARTIWAVGDRRVLVSRDAGATWHALERSPFVTALARDPIAADTLYAGTIRTGIVRSVDAGRSWMPTGGDLAADIELVGVGASNVLYASAWAGGVLALFTSSDGGRSWARGLLDEANAPRVIAADPQDASTVYAGTYRGLWKTTDGGAHWRRIRVRPVASAAPDLVPTAFSAAHSSAPACLGADVSFSVTNTGTGAVAAVPLTQTIYLSTDDTLGRGDMPVGYSFWRGGVAPGGGYSTRGSITLPIAPAGPYFLIFRVDENGPPDAHEAENVRAIPFTVAGDPTAHLRQLEEWYESGAMGPGQYELDRRQWTQYFVECLAHVVPLGARCARGRYKFIVDRVDRALKPIAVGMRIDLDGDAITLGPTCPSAAMRVAETNEGTTLAASARCAGRDATVTFDGHVDAPGCDILAGRISVDGQEPIAVHAHLLNCNEDPEATPRAISAAVNALSSDATRGAWGDLGAFSALVQQQQARLGCSFHRSR